MAATLDPRRLTNPDGTMHYSYDTVRALAALGADLSALEATTTLWVVTPHGQALPVTVAVR